jgi:predicted nucleic acid-binding protein
LSRFSATNRELSVDKPSLLTIILEHADPKDDHLLELAIASGAESIVTHNTKDFKDVEKFGVRSITPKELLEEVL